MSFLALCVCLAFVTWALVRDCRRNPASSPALWLPVLWMIRCGSRSTNYWTPGIRTDPLLIGLLVLLGLAVLMRRRIDWAGLVRDHGALFLFFGYLFLSLSWARELDSPAVKIVRPLGDLIMALVLATDPKPREAIITLFRRTALVLIPFSLALIFFLPGQGIIASSGWWKGVTTEKNPLGQLCLVAVLAFTWTLHGVVRRHRETAPPARTPRVWHPMLRQFVRWLHGLHVPALLRHPLALIYLMLTLFLLNGGGHSRSSTAILCLGVALGLFLLLGKMRRQVDQLVARLAALVGAFLLFALILHWFGTSPQAFVAGLFGKDATLTDRALIWRDVIRLGMEAPLLGAGYGNFWTDSIYREIGISVMSDFTFLPNQAHNGYLEVFANLGLVGVFLLAMAILQALSSSVSLAKQDFEYARIRLVLLATTLVLNYSEATFPRGTHLWWFTFLVAAVYARPRVAWSARAPRRAPARNFLWSRPRTLPSPVAPRRLGRTSGLEGASPGISSSESSLIEQIQPNRTWKL